MLLPLCFVLRYELNLSYDPTLTINPTIIYVKELSNNISFFQRSHGISALSKIKTHKIYP